MKTCVKFLLVTVCVLAVPTRAQDISSQVVVDRRMVASNTDQRYFLIEHKKSASTTEPRGLVLILPGGPGNADFLPFCANVLTVYGIPEDFVVAELVAPQWKADPNRVVWPSKSFPDRDAKFTTEEFIAAVIKEVSKIRKIDERFILTLGWSSSGHALYAASFSEPRVKGSIIAMSRFMPSRLGNLDDAKGKNYFLYHSPEDQTCRFSEAELAVRTLKAHAANVKLVTYKGGHGWVINSSYCDRIREGIEWLKGQSIDSDLASKIARAARMQTNRTATATAALKQGGTNQVGLFQTVALSLEARPLNNEGDGFGQNEWEGRPLFYEAQKTWWTQLPDPDRLQDIFAAKVSFGL